MCWSPLKIYRRCAAFNRDPPCIVECATTTPLNVASARIRGLTYFHRLSLIVRHDFKTFSYVYLVISSNNMLYLRRKYHTLISNFHTSKKISTPIRITAEVWCWCISFFRILFCTWIVNYACVYRCVCTSTKIGPFQLYMTYKSYNLHTKVNRLVFQ